MAASDTWTITNTAHDPHALGQFNSACTVSNGYCGLKGNLGEQRDGYSPVTLINGVYDELDMFSLLRPTNEERRYLDARYFDTAGRSPAVANVPNPLFVQVLVGEREVSFSRGGIDNFVQLLDLGTGVYSYRYDYRDGWGRTTRIEMQRFASLKHAHRVFMRYSITPVDHEASIRVRSGISGNVYSNTTRERQFRVTELWTDPATRCRLFAQTPAREHEVQLGVEHKLRAGRLRQDPVGVAEHDVIYTEFAFEPAQGSTITLERCMALTCSEDLRHRVVAKLDDEIDAAAAQGFDGALDEQRELWEPLWQRCDVRIEGDDEAQRFLRFCLFHLIQAAPRFTDRLSVPVKLLTGEYYQGNTFYDTETYILPFLTFTRPDYARTCLNYRYEALRPAREIARNLGYDGAKFAWQSGPYGEECLGRWWRFTHTNIHINADVSYALMQYYWATGDRRFVQEHGIDILVETARFYASRARYDAGRERYDIADVAGPDEGHCESTNNFFTNYLAIRNLRWAADMLAELAEADADAHEAAVRRLAVRADEPDKWRRVAARLALLYDPETKVYEQCEGFYQLKPNPKDLLDERKVWFVTVFPYQALNQPDVLMAMVLFRDAFDPDVFKANYDFYYDKSMNFSSMSFVINAIASRWAGRMDEAYRNFLISAGADVLEDLTGRRDTYAGLHGTAAGGAWMAAVFGFGGVHLSEQGLRIDPCLPEKWTALRFTLVLRGVPVEFTITPEAVAYAPAASPRLELPVTIAGQAVTLRSGEAGHVRYGT